MQGRARWWNGTPSFYHASVSAIVHYDMPALLDIFYKVHALHLARVTASSSP